MSADAGDEAEWRAFTAELDAWRADGRVATLWWRDDDAGPPEPALERLLALAETTGVPLGLAVVPAWLSPETAHLVRASHAPVRVLQHGFAHTNHETMISPGARKIRPAECGGARPAVTVLAEIRDAGTRLQTAVGGRYLAVFVPPWNRIASEVVTGLPSAGYHALSAFGPRATSRPAPGLLQLNCHADPIVWREAKRFVGAGATLERLRRHLTARREGHIDPGEPTGLLTHHRDLSPAFWAFIGEFFTRLRQHPAVAFPSLASLVEPPEP